MSLETASRRRPNDISGDGMKRASAAIMPVYDHGQPASGVSGTAVPARDGSHSYGRYSDQPMDWRTRLTGLSATMLVILILVVSVLVTWRAVQSRVAPPTPLMAVSLQPLAAPPEPAVEVPEGPAQIEQRERKPKEEERPDPPPIRIPRFPLLTQPSSPLVEPAPVSETVPETTAPKSLPAPPASRAANNSVVTWEGQLLAHLEKYRRYPAAARARRVQGVAYVTFSMNRQGRVLTVTLARSSGSVLLDRAALETIRRAQPLPGIPEDRPNVQELSVPVEFFVRK